LRVGDQGVQNFFSAVRKKNKKNKKLYLRLEGNI
jgi:hypothetical protein